MGYKGNISVVLIFCLFVCVAAKTWAVASAHSNEIIWIDGNPNLQDLGGTLTATGYVYINGNEAKTGATIMSGNTISTRMDGEAIIDLGALGRIHLRPDTSIKLTLSPGEVKIEMLECGSLTQILPAGVTSRVEKSENGLVEVAVLPGEARVNSSSSTDGTVVRGGENKVFENFDSVTATGVTTFTLNCCDCDVPAGGFIFPLWGILGLGGAAAGAITGVGIGDEDDPVSSPNP